MCITSTTAAISLLALAQVFQPLLVVMGKTTRGTRSTDSAAATRRTNIRHVVGFDSSMRNTLGLPPPTFEANPANLPVPVPAGLVGSVPPLPAGLIADERTLSGTVSLAKPSAGDLFMPGVI